MSASLLRLKSLYFLGSSSALWPLEVAINLTAQLLRENSITVPSLRTPSKDPKAVSNLSFYTWLFLNGFHLDSQTLPRHICQACPRCLGSLPSLSRCHAWLDCLELLERERRGRKEKESNEKVVINTIKTFPFGSQIVPGTHYVNTNNKLK